MKYSGRAMLVCLVSWAALAPARADWTARQRFDPVKNETRCVVESATRKIHDGYDTTTVMLRVDHDRLLIVTGSNIDVREKDTGIQVDGGELIPVDEVYLDQNAVVMRRFKEAITQFRRGLKAEVHLRFWPTWPSKGRKSATFNLLGFRKAYASLPNCQ